MNYSMRDCREFLHGISLHLCSLKSAQYWRYDEKTAKEIEYLEELYARVEKDMDSKREEIIECLNS